MFGKRALALGNCAPPDREARTGPVVFIPRRVGELNSATTEIRTPVAFALVVVAVLGWAVAAFLAAQLIQGQSRQGGALGRSGSGGELIQGCGSPL